MTRYEAIFMVFIVCVLIVMQNKLHYAIIIGIAAILPVVIYGLWSMAHGWYLLPNSIILKGNLPGFSPAEILNSLGIALVKILIKIDILILLVNSSFLLLIYTRKKGN